MAEIRLFRYGLILELTALRIIWLLRAGWSQHSFSLLRLRLMDRESECPDYVSIIELSSMGLILEAGYLPAYGEEQLDG